MNRALSVVLVCTGWRKMHKLDRAKTMVREWFDYIESHYGSIVTVVEGGADGADRLCKEEALRREISVVTIEADWTLGKKAGPIRNQEMADFAAECEQRGGVRIMGLAFVAPMSTGTNDCRKRLQNNGWYVETVNLPGTEAVA